MTTININMLGFPPDSTVNLTDVEAATYGRYQLHVLRTSEGGFGYACHDILTTKQIELPPDIRKILDMWIDSGYEKIIPLQEFINKMFGEQ